MPNFNLDDYEPVQSRIKRFYAKYPDGRIITKMVNDISDIQTAVFRVCIYNAETLLATGWAFEREGAGYVNKTCHLENCETSAIGRALANIGLDGDKRPSREEMQKVQAEEKKIVVEKKEVPDEVTQKAKEVQAKCKASGRDWTEYKQYLSEKYPQSKLSDVIFINYEAIMKELAIPQDEELPF